MANSSADDGLGGDADLEVAPEQILGELGKGLDDEERLASLPNNIHDNADFPNELRLLKLGRLRGHGPKDFRKEGRQDRNVFLEFRLDHEIEPVLAG